MEYKPLTDEQIREMSALVKSPQCIPSNRNLNNLQCSLCGRQWRFEPASNWTLECSAQLRKIRTFVPLAIEEIARLKALVQELEVVASAPELIKQIISKVAGLHESDTQDLTKLRVTTLYFTEFCIRLQAELEQARRSLNNVYMLSKRERRKTIGRERESWDHLIRFCMEAGCKSSLLRSDMESEVP